MVTPTHSDLLKLCEEMAEALEAISSNSHLHLGDLVYSVREYEGLGWEGPAVKAWGEAVEKVAASLASYRKRMNLEMKEGSK